MKHWVNFCVVSVGFGLAGGVLLSSGCGQSPQPPATPAASESSSPAKSTPAPATAAPAETPRSAAPSTPPPVPAETSSTTEAAPSPAETADADNAAGVTPSAEDLAALRSLVRENVPQAHGHESTPPRPAPKAESSGPLRFTAPDDWKSVKPSNRMRQAQYTLPRAEGDSEDGELVVFYFGPGEGGGVRENLTRWQGQFTGPDGAALPEDAVKHEKFEANGMPVTVMEVSGRFAPGAMPGMPAVGPRENFHMVAAIVETPSAPWFIKATGPAATMENHAAAIRAFLKSAEQ